MRTVSAVPAATVKVDRSDYSEDEVPWARYCKRCQEVIAAYGHAIAAETSDSQEHEIYRHNISDLRDIFGEPSCRLCVLFKDDWQRDMGFKVHCDSFNLAEQSKPDVQIDNQGPESRGQFPCVLSYYRIYREGLDLLKLKIQLANNDTFAGRLADTTFALVQSTARNPLGTTTGSESALETANMWLNKCLSEHSCHQTAHFLPTRLLDIGHNSTSEVRIVLKETLEEGTNYLTLSHCWGQHLPLRLLSSNKDSMMMEVPSSKIPSLFGDAISVTRAFNQRYLWIDCLCIIQDDLLDWQRESSQMGNIYRYSLCNLSATMAGNSLDSMFQPRSSVKFTVTDVPISFHNDTLGYHVVSHLSWMYSVEDSILNSRGWVCQERFLSPCNLQFAPGQLHWECNTMSANETMPYGFPRTVSFLESKEDTKRVVSAAISIPSPGISFMEEREANWKRLLTLYTKSNLTFATDRLVALSGLASVWASTHNDEYVAGLWRSNLIIGLLWSKTIEPADLVGSYIAPTWSWAGSSGRVIDRRVHESFHGKSLPWVSPEVLDVKIEYVDPNNRYGQITSGKLKLKALLGSIPSETFLQWAGLSSGDSDVSNWAIEWCFDYDKDSILRMIVDTQDIFFLPIFVRKTCGLILKQANDTPEFIRLGAYFGAGTKVATRFLDACELFGKHSLARLMEPNVDGDSDFIKYTINLI